MLYLAEIEAKITDCVELIVRQKQVVEKGKIIRRFGLCLNDKKKLAINSSGCCDKILYNPRCTMKGVYTCFSVSNSEGSFEDGLLSRQKVFKVVRIKSSNRSCLECKEYEEDG